MDLQNTRSLIEASWNGPILDTLVDFIKIPNRSPHFDPHWAEAGHMDKAVALVENWCRSQDIKGLTVEVVRLAGRTPLIFMEIPGDLPGTVVLYGHLDKQPEMVGWAEGLGPWTPVLRDDKLYGRGGADDGYSAFASLTAIRALQAAGVPHARCVVMIEASEESGSPDLPAYVDTLAPRIGDPDLVICLDSGCGDYDRLWCTTSLRGMVGARVKIEVLTEGVHSGDASGIVPSSFRVGRLLLDRLEDSATGRIKLPELHVDIPEERLVQARAAAEILADAVWSKFPWKEGVHPVSNDVMELILGRTWRPTLSVIGAGGLPSVESAGNVLRPVTSLVLSFRLPPSCDSERACAALREALTSNPPYGAAITVDMEGSSGWQAPATSPWLARAMGDASSAWFGRDAAAMGEGGSIPFMGMLGHRYPRAQFLITGVLGPMSNAHGPNEFLHLPTAARLTGCVAHVIAEHGRNAQVL